MKKLILLSVLILASGLDGENVGFPNHATAAGVPSEMPGARPGYEYGKEHQINARAEKYPSNEKKLHRAAGPTSEIEARKLKLIFLLMMSLGQYRAPVH